MRRALLNLFPGAVLTESEGWIRAEAADLEAFRARIHDQHIRDTARDQMIAGRQGNTLRFTLSKQAAYVGRVSFAAGSSLGDIAVTVETENTDALIDHVAESTVGKRLSLRTNRDTGDTGNDPP